jgi:TPR repeat protein
MKKIALLIGVEEYQDRMITPLLFARADAEALAEKLRIRCHFDHIHILSEREGPNSPSLGHIIDKLRDISGEVRSEDIFLFFYAGHGVEKDGHGHLLPMDSRAGPEVGDLPLSALQEILRRMDARQRILIIDACRNYPQVGRGAEANLLSEGLYRDIVAISRANRTSTTTTCLLSACQSGQRARIWLEKKHGVLTYFLLEGIDGAAWKGEILDFDDLASYTRDQVVLWTSSRFSSAEQQVPWYEKYGAPARVILAISRAADPKPKPIAQTASASKLSEEEEKKLAEKAKSDAEAFKRCLEAAKQGDAVAQFNIGWFYDLGRGANMDKAKAVEWYRKAAEAGLPAAQFNLGWSYSHGEGVQEDRVEAVKWYRKAAEQGLPAAQFNIGLSYSHGEGVKEDKAEAVKWYRNAAKQGDASAQSKLGWCYDVGEGLKENKAKAVKWYLKAAKQGDIAAQFNLGLIYDFGEGMNENKAEASKWFRKAAEQGDAAAQYNLGVCYEKGEGVEKNIAAAINWYSKAAKQGFVKAQEALDRCYRLSDISEKK